MQKIIGKYSSAMVYSDTAEDYAVAQVKVICDNSTALGSKVRVMPDVHPGHIGPVGLSMTVNDKVMPGLVGSDIGCGVSYLKIRKTNIEFQKLDKVIRESVPSGESIRKTPHRFSDDFDINDLICRKHINENKAKLSLGTLGGGNHFIEIEEYKRVMKGIYSSTICAGTLDEAPFAYRSMDEILLAIEDSVEVKKILKPLYNYKAGERR